MNNQTALDTFVSGVQTIYRLVYPHHKKTQHNIDWAVGLHFDDGNYPRQEILADPRYIAFCKEQDKIRVLQVAHHQGYREEWLSDGRFMVHKDHCEGEQVGVFDTDCALAGLGWHYPPGTFKKEQDRRDANQDMNHLRTDQLAALKTRGKPTFRNIPNVGTFLSDPGDRPLKTRGKVTWDESLGDLEEKCEKCDGAGWLWAHELDVYEGNPSFDDTRYSCDKCCRPRLQTQASHDEDQPSSGLVTLDRLGHWN